MHKICINHNVLGTFSITPMPEKCYLYTQALLDCCIAVTSPPTNTRTISYAHSTLYTCLL